MILSGGQFRSFHQYTLDIFVALFGKRCSQGLVCGTLLFSAQPLHIGTGSRLVKKKVRCKVTLYKITIDSRRQLVSKYLNSFLTPVGRISKIYK